MARSKTESGDNRWGKIITVVIVIFILHLAVLVLIVSVQKFDLVRRDYYPAELKYQQHINRIERSLQLSSNLLILYQPDAKRIEITFPDSLKSEIITGSIHLYRPSDASLDRSFDLEFGLNGIMMIAAQDLVKGMWRIKVSWQVGTIEYFDEAVIVI